MKYSFSVYTHQLLWDDLRLYFLQWCHSWCSHHALKVNLWFHTAATTFGTPLNETHNISWVWRSDNFPDEVGLLQYISRALCCSLRSAVKLPACCLSWRFQEIAKERRDYAVHGHTQAHTEYMTHLCAHGCHAGRPHASCGRVWWTVVLMLASFSTIKKTTLTHTYTQRNDTPQTISF